jgi:hypothetical protein
MFKHGITLVLGSGAFADQVAAALSRNGQSVRRVHDADTATRTLRSANRLLLAEPNGLHAAALADAVAQVGNIDPQARIHLGHDPEPMPGIAPAEAGWRYLCWPRAAARILLNRYPLHFGADVAAGHAPQLLILGFGAMGEAITVQALRLGHYGVGDLGIDVICPNPDQAAKGFANDYPQAHRLPCKLRFHDIAAPWPLADTLTSAYISLNDDQATLASTRDLAERLQANGRRPPPLFPMLGQTPAPATVRDWDGLTYPFMPLTEACAQATTSDGPRDALAHIIHDHYQDTIASQARDAASAPAAVPWHSLDESYRDASRNQADHVPAKLSLIRAHATEAPGQALFTFAPDDVEHLAQVEHDRWAADRILAGWAYAPERDNQRKLHPDLVPFEQLSEPTKDLDRYAVRLLPALLGRRELSVQTNLRVLVWLQDDAKPGRALHKNLIARLSARYPDRYLTLYCRLANAAEQQIIRFATREYAVALRVLFATATASPTDRRYLKLLAHAEARYRITQACPDHDWLHEQVDIICSDHGGLAQLLAGDTKTHPRVVELPAGSPHPLWHFEY